MGWLIALAIIVLIAILPLGASVKYDSGGVLVRIIAGPIRFTLFPMKKKDKPPKKTVPKEDKTPQSKETPQQTNKPEKTEPEAPKKKSGGKLTDFLPLVRVALDCLGDFPKTLRVNVLEVKLILAGDDPCDLATNYGRIWAAVGNLWPRLERVLIIKKRDINVECDFTADETVIYARLDLTLTLARLLSWLVRYGVRALKVYLKIMKSRKGGAVT